MHVIGNSTGGRGGLFGYNRGFVRNAFLHGQQGSFCFFSLCHQSPTNHGDSGGPVANDDGELVATISHGTTGGGGEREQVVDYSVHVKEIRAFLDGKPTYKKPCLFPSGDVVLKATAFHELQRDTLVLRVRKSEKLEVEVKGNGKSDLDLFIDPGLNARGFERIAQTCP